MATRQVMRPQRLPSRKTQVRRALRQMAWHLEGMAVTSKRADSFETAAVVRSELVGMGLRLPEVGELARLLQQTPEYAELEQKGLLRWQMVRGGPPVYRFVPWDDRLTSCCQSFALPSHLGNPVRNEFSCRCCGQIELRFYSERDAADYRRYVYYRGELRSNVVVTTPGKPCPHRK